MDFDERALMEESRLGKFGTIPDESESTSVKPESQNPNC